MDNEQTISDLTDVGTTVQRKGHYFTPEWFSTKAKEQKYVEQEKEMQKWLAWFQEKYGPKQLKRLSGKALLDYLFYNDTDEKENLCYSLEMKPEIRDYFGGISGGAAYKFSLFYHKANHSWMTGSPSKPQALAEEEAIALGTQIRDSLVAGAEVIEKYRNINDIEGYTRLSAELNDVVKTSSVWILKYYEMLFPSLFCPIYAEGFQKRFLYCLQIEPDNNHLVRMGQCNLFSRRCGISPLLLPMIADDVYAWYKWVFIINAGGENASFADWVEKEYCALDFSLLGDFRQYKDAQNHVEKKKLSDALVKSYDSLTASKATSYAGEIINYLRTDVDKPYIVAVDGQNVLGIGQAKGGSKYEADADSCGNRRAVDWLFIPDTPIPLPTDELHEHVYIKMENAENMMLIQRTLQDCVLGEPASIDEKYPEDSGNDSLADGNVKNTRYWMYTVFDDNSWAECQAKKMMVIGVDEIGDYTHYSSKEEIRQTLISKYGGNSNRRNQALMAWSFSHTIKPGDIIFAKRANTLVGKGTVTGEYVFDDTRPEYKSIREVNWTNIGERKHPGKAVVKRLTNITPYTDYVKDLCALFDDGTEGTPSVPEEMFPHYSEEDFLRDVYMSADDYHTLVGVLMKKKNIILQGAPGVGKTYAARRLAYSIMGKEDPNRVMMIQFHQSYSYEDFIEGYRPTADGFSLKKGVFYNFCKKAREDNGNKYFFIIDEINRGNLSKIFGELFMLIETDKRGEELRLLYSDEKFSVPKNVHIIGMMNTADRSLAMLDYALRRRFSFIDMNPGFDTDGFKKYRDSLASDKFNTLISRVQELNEQIKDDAALGEGFCIGHSYFCGLEPGKVSDNDLSDIVEYELLPLLREYWFDEANKVAEWSANLRGAVK